MAKKKQEEPPKGSPAWMPDSHGRHFLCERQFIWNVHEPILFA